MPVLSTKTFICYTSKKYNFIAIFVAVKLCKLVILIRNYLQKGNMGVSCQRLILLDKRKGECMWAVRTVQAPTNPSALGVS